MNKEEMFTKREYFKRTGNCLLFDDEMVDLSSVSAVETYIYDERNGHGDKPFVKILFCIGEQEVTTVMAYDSAFWQLQKDELFRIWTIARTKERA